MLPNNTPSFKATRTNPSQKFQLETKFSHIWFYGGLSHSIHQTCISEISYCNLLIFRDELNIFIYVSNKGKMMRYEAFIMNSYNI